MIKKMKRRLQVRFVLLSVAALIPLQAAIVAFSIYRSYRQMTLRADTIIKLTESIQRSSNEVCFEVQHAQQ